VRVHPGELLGAGQPSVEVIESALPELPDHVLVIPPEAKVNTYDLIELADVGLVYTTTVGLEMAMSGIPVVVAGRTHYRGKGFTHDPESWAAYVAIIRELLESPERHRLSQQQVDLAWRYAYVFFFDFPRPYPWHLLGFWNDLKERPMEQVLTPEGLRMYEGTLEAMLGEPVRWGNRETASG
jgi:capsule polysaccharide export protein KpsC/LpsZ